MANHVHRATLFRLLESLGEDAWQENILAGEVCISSAFWNSLGYSRDALPLTREDAEALLHPLDVQLATEEAALHLKSQEPLELEVRVRSSNLDWRFIRIRGCVTEWDECRRPTVIAGTLHDFTDQVHAARTDFRATELITTLSRRECQVLDQIVAGAATKNIAHTLGLSTRTVEGYRARILEKLGVKGTSALVQLALAGGVRRGMPSNCAPR